MRKTYRIPRLKKNNQKNYSLKDVRRKYFEKFHKKSIDADEKKKRENIYVDEHKIYDSEIEKSVFDEAAKLGAIILKGTASKGFAKNGPYYLDNRTLKKAGVGEVLKKSLKDSKLTEDEKERNKVWLDAIEHGFGLIFLGDSGDLASMAHELGHHETSLNKPQSVIKDLAEKANRKIKGGDDFYYTMCPKFSQIIGFWGYGVIVYLNESLATKNGLKILERHGLSNEKMEEIKKVLKQSLNTYKYRNESKLYDMLSHLILHFGKR